MPLEVQGAEAAEAAQLKLVVVAGSCAESAAGWWCIEPVLIGQLRAVA
ncbi:hypothetical protein WL1483_862 [Aeromonas schubertii]|uniref:Uncharacterized protein n=1 Tax=Aeromonas schubertii TaxID=652 RepID=A0A0S2SEZ2_9GAMM|nr:hypothetical protein WL1483_862 [Aeromonas schubertii]